MRVGIASTEPREFVEAYDAALRAGPVLSGAVVLSRPIPIC